MTQHLPEKLSWLFPAIGAVCVLLPMQITAVLPYLLGGAMAVVGTLQSVKALRQRTDSEVESTGLTHGSILVIMGLAFLIQGPGSLGPIGTTWAILGIRKSAESLNHVICQRRAMKNIFLPMVEFLVRITLSLLLLFDPFAKFSAHVMILGLELIAVSIRFSKSRFPTVDI